MSNMNMVRAMMETIKNSMTVEDVIEIMHDLGSNHTHLSDNPVFQTICHNHIGEGSFKLYYYDNTKLFRCYTGCQEAFDIFDAISKAKTLETGMEWNSEDALTWYQNRMGFALFNNKSEDNNLRREINIKDYEKPNLEVYKSTMLKNLPFIPIADWLEEGIDLDTQERFEIKYYPTNSAVVFPHYNAEGDLVGIRQRTMNQEEIDRYGKYRPANISGITYAHPLSFNLFGINRNKDRIKTMKKAILFEGEKSVMKFESLFGTESNVSVACCGSNFSLHQFHIFKELGVEEIVVAFDKQFKELGDEEFEHLTKNLRRIHDRYSKYITISFMFDKKGLLDYKDSPIDKGKEVFLELFKDRFTLDEGEEE